MSRASRRTVVLVPGFNGEADQPILVVLAALLEAKGLRPVRVALPKGKPSPGLAVETDALDRLAGKGRVMLVGRSFGGRVSLRLCARRAIDAVVLLGFPIRPPGRKRPEDEAALKAVACPTLVLQGARDELGSAALVKRVAKSNPRVEVRSIRGAGHSFGRAEKDVLQQAAAWLAERASE